MLFLLYSSIIIKNASFEAKKMNGMWKPRITQNISWRTNDKNWFLSISYSLLTWFKTFGPPMPIVLPKRRIQTKLI